MLFLFYSNYYTNRSSIYQIEQLDLSLDNIYYIDLVKAIKKQLYSTNIKKENITESPYDTYLSNNYYSHTEEIKDKSSKIGQNFVGCFYTEIKN